MTMAFPDVGKNRRWSVEKRKYYTYTNIYSHITGNEYPYYVLLEEMTHKSFFGRETWNRLELHVVKDLETDTLLEAAKVILERVAKSEWEKSRLGTYPPLVLEK